MITEGLNRGGVPNRRLWPSTILPDLRRALLGDRLRMIQHSNDPNVFIRSIANRGVIWGA